MYNRNIESKSHKGTKKMSNYQKAQNVLTQAVAAASAFKMQKGTKVAFVYNGSVRIGQIRLIGSNYMKVKTEDGLTKTYSTGKMKNFVIR
jgi:hypothetical protein